VRTPTERLAAKLQDPNATFTRDQLIYVAASMARWAREAVEGEPSPLAYAAGFDDGYRARVAEENAAYPPERDPVVVGLVGFIDRADYRRRCDAEASQPRPGDFQGGLPAPLAEFECEGCSTGTHASH
jgi:hypothetical protein